MPYSGVLSILIDNPSSEHSLTCKVEIVSTEQCHLLTTVILFSLSLNLLSEVHSIRKIIQYFISWDWLICLTLCPYNTWYYLYQRLFSLEACTRIAFLWRLFSTIHHFIHVFICWWTVCYFCVRLLDTSAFHFILYPNSFFMYKKWHQALKMFSFHFFFAILGNDNFSLKYGTNGLFLEI